MGHLIFWIFHLVALAFGAIGLVVTIPLHLIYASTKRGADRADQAARLNTTIGGQRMQALRMQAYSFRLTTLSVAAFLAGCSSVEPISGANATPIPTAGCQVTVYQTRAQATKRGEIEELCIITGTSSGSFSHTIATAIEKHKSKACACGAINAYVESRRSATFDVASVTMVAFRYIDPPPRKKQP